MFAAVGHHLTSEFGASTLALFWRPDLGRIFVVIQGAANGPESAISVSPKINFFKTFVVDKISNFIPFRLDHFRGFFEVQLFRLNPSWASASGAFFLLAVAITLNGLFIFFTVFRFINLCIKNFMILMSSFLCFEPALWRSGRLHMLRLRKPTLRLSDMDF